MKASTALCWLATLACYACGDGATADPPDGPRADARHADAAAIDAPGVDAPRSDASTTDPCVAGKDDAKTTVGCNGGILGANEPAGTLGSECTLSGTPQGSCNHNLICSGICVQACEAQDTYVSRSNCPTGTRCLTFDQDGFCFPDCNSDGDCASDSCDDDGSCVIRSN